MDVVGLTPYVLAIHGESLPTAFAKNFGNRTICVTELHHGTAITLCTTARISLCAETATIGAQARYVLHVCILQL